MIACSVEQGSAGMTRAVTELIDRDPAGAQPHSYSVCVAMLAGCSGDAGLADQR